MPRGEHRNDRRVRRTKKLLVQALTQLMSEKQVNEITVKELTQLADVNRGTFYLYYSDIYDMLHTTQNELLAALEDIAGRHRENSARGELSPMLEELFEHIGQNSEMWRVLLSPTGDMSFLHRLNQLLRESFSWMQSVSETPRGAAEWDFRYSFGVFGCAGLIRSWLDSDAPALRAMCAKAGLSDKDYRTLFETLDAARCDEVRRLMEETEAHLTRLDQILSAGITSAQQDQSHTRIRAEVGDIQTDRD